MQGLLLDTNLHLASEIMVERERGGEREREILKDMVRGERER